MSKCQYNYKGRTYTEEQVKPVINYHYAIEDDLIASGLFEKVGKEVFVKETPIEIKVEKIKKSFQKQSFINENLKETEFGIRDLAARLAARIGGNVRFESDLTKDYAGYNEGNTSVINLAKATLDTPIHEIVGHPIIRALRNTKLDKDEFLGDKTDEVKILYDNLLKELETGYGKEVLDRVKKEYGYKKDIPYMTTMPDGSTLYYNKQNNTAYTHNNNNPSDRKYYTTEKEIRDLLNLNDKYTLEEQQEEALVQLLGELTAGKIKETKENKNLISLLKQLLKQMTAYMRSLFNSKEIEIDKLSADMTLNDLANLLAYTNSKIILPGNRVEYTTPDNQKFATYQEASNHISKLFRESKDVNLSDVTINNSSKLPNEFLQLLPFGDYVIKNENGVWNKYEYDNGKLGKLINENLTLEQVKQDYKLSNTLNSFIEKNKQFEQSKEIIETWKKENNIVYNPDEVYSRGQGFYSAIGAYSTLELDLLLQNLLQHIEDNKKAGGEFNISAFTKPVEKRIGHLEGESSVRFVIYPKSEDIKWAAPTDVYSGSVWDAAEKVSKDKKSELLGVSHTKYPSLNNVTEVSPNLADIIDNRSHHHNELAIELTFDNFLLEADDTVPYEIKQLVKNVNSILEQKRVQKVNEFIESLEKEC